MNLGKKTLAVLLFCFITNLATATETKATGAYTRPIISTTVATAISLTLIAIPAIIANSETLYCVGATISPLTGFLTGFLVYRQSINYELRKSVKEGDVEKVKALLESKFINVNTKEVISNVLGTFEYNLFDLFDSFEKSNDESFEEIAPLLIEKGYDVHSNNGSFNTAAIHKAVSHNSLKVVQQLIDKKVDINPQDAHGDTSLHRAVQINHYDIAKLLVESNADTTIKNNDKETAYDVAVKKNHNKIAELLKPKFSEK
ncbi:MAG: ankyrin repeat domain-containing protein [bacterium]